MFIVIVIVIVLRRRCIHSKDDVKNFPFAKMIKENDRQYDTNEKTALKLP